MSLMLHTAPPRSRTSPVGRGTATDPARGTSARGTRRSGSRLTLEQLRVFIAVGEREHLTRAANALHISQSAVSATIAALEAEFAVALFDRAGRGLRLTPGGAILLVEARAVLRRVEEARHRLAQFSDPARRINAADDGRS